MPAQAVAIKRTGLVTSVGLSAPATCAAIRAKISNPTETRFIDSGGEWIMGHRVALEEALPLRDKLTRMTAMAIAEGLEEVPPDEWGTIPLLLCAAEPEQPGRHEGLAEQLLNDIQHELGARFAPSSSVIAYGRVSAGVALAQARKLVLEAGAPLVLIAAGDSLLSWPALSAYEREDRLLTPHNSNGFMPGEAAGALLVGRPKGEGELLCAGIGFAVESASVGSGEPLRADGLTNAIRAALADAGCEMHDLDFRITDLSGEHYYFKEAALALSRILRQRRDEFDLWHPAECIGECGAAAGVAIVAVANDACRKAYSAGRRILAHMSNDSGRRAAIVLLYAG